MGSNWRVVPKPAIAWYIYKHVPERLVTTMQRKTKDFSGWQPIGCQLFLCSKIYEALFLDILAFANDERFIFTVYRGSFPFNIRTFFVGTYYVPNFRGQSDMIEVRYR